jgi:hypothetical protein
MSADFEGEGGHGRQTVCRGAKRRERQYPFATSTTDSIFSPAT